MKGNEATLATLSTVKTAAIAAGKTQVDIGMRSVNPRLSNWRPRKDG
jgi:hypothetical protein